MNDMKEFRILITDIPKSWDDDDWTDIQGELDSVMSRWLSKHDYTISVWDVG
ncbi:MAG TPA: hypothetical protein VIY48_14420 [Candidatus Paceibacterota bacterium]